MQTELFTDLILDGSLLFASLNGGRDFGRERQRFAYFPFSEDPTDHAQADQIYREATEEFRRHLWALVDAWIESGRNTQGVWEFPRARNLSRLPEITYRLREWLNRQDLAGCMSFETGEVRFDVSRYPFYGFDNRDPEEYAQDEAVRLFVWLLNLPKLKHAIARCPECNRYYQRAKPRQFYKRPTFCPDCRNPASVKRRMAEARLKQRLQITKAAAAGYERWSSLSNRSRKKYGNERSYVTRRVVRFGVTGKWLTRNRLAIEKELAQLAVARRNTCEAVK